ncbi:hypothetical protein [Natrononativus amylolyticus]|uniref:hypothetical protein n=1 Tax=Natrononativus amylolyticus TaxID=2963434 RepID=UPI0020CF148A|nr:hypothetical protein [Natrononativus amylolyticus]
MTLRDEDDLRRWALLDGTRLVVAGLLTGFVFVLFLALGAAGLIPTEDFGPLRTMVGAVLGGTLPFITVVLAINQLILSAEFGTTGTFRNRLEETREFRSTVERDVDIDLSPADPAQFLRTLVLAARERAIALRTAADETATDEAFRERVDHYVADVVAEMDAGADELETARFGTFDVTSVILDLDDPLHLQRARRLRVEHEIDDEVATAIADLETVLDDIHVARQYFKTVHIQQELANLSRLLLYVGFLALVVGGSLLLADTRLGEFITSDALSLLLVALIASVVVLPFTVLFAYVLRIATVARRTAADFGPFLLQQRIPEEDRP